MRDLHMIFLPPELHCDEHQMKKEFHLVYKSNTRNIMLYKWERPEYCLNASIHSFPKSQKYIADMIASRDSITPDTILFHVIVQQALPLEYKTVKKQGQWEGSLIASRLLWIGDSSFPFFPLHINQSRWLKYDYKFGDLICIRKIQLLTGRKNIKGAKTTNDSNIKVLFNVYNMNLENLCDTDYLKKDLIPWFLSQHH